jgi:hypothetical protein
MSNTTIYRGNSNNKGNRNGKIFGIIVVSAAVLVTLKLVFLWAWPWWQ